MEKESKKVAFHTLGCKLNYAETSMIARQFESAGYTKTPFQEAADLYVINTCSVTENADREFRKIVNRAKRLAPDSQVAVIGCYAQLRPEQIVDHGKVDLVLGAREKFNLLQHINFKSSAGQSLVIQDNAVDELHGCVPSYSLGDRTRSFLKIQDGCDYPCTYCTIPLARGRSRSLEVETLLNQAGEIVTQGVKEIVLTGVNVGDYHTAQDESLLELLQALEAVDGLERIRISSIEPNLLTDQIIEHVSASIKVLPHFHIPLQSGSDSILGAMKRRYLSDLYRDRVAAVRRSIPKAGIGADVIVGFPGEGDAEFAETVKLIESLDLTYLHVFTYSERPDTPAFDMPGRVKMSARKDRNRILTQLSDRKNQIFALRNINQSQQVLFESQAGELATGMTENYVKVYVNSPTENLANQIRSVEITAVKEGQIQAELL